MIRNGPKLTISASGRFERFSLLPLLNCMIITVNNSSFSLKEKDRKVEWSNGRFMDNNPYI